MAEKYIHSMSARNDDVQVSVNGAIATDPVTTWWSMPDASGVAARAASYTLAVPPPSSGPKRWRSSSVRRYELSEATQPAVVPAFPVSASHGPPDAPPVMSQT